MRESENSLRVEYWQSKAKAMQNRIEELEKKTAYMQASVDGFDTHIVSMREWAKTVAKQIKELQNESENLKSKEGNRG